MGFKFDAELSVSEIELSAAKAIWGENVSESLSRQMFTLPFGIEVANIEINEGKILCRGIASIDHDEGALSEVLSKWIPVLIRNGLAAELRSLGKDLGGVIFVEPGSFTPEYIQILIHSGTLGLLGHLKSQAMAAVTEDFDSPNWLLSIRCNTVLNQYDCRGFELPPSMESHSKNRLRRYLEKVMETMVLGRNFFKILCEDFLKGQETQPRKFTRKEFRDWDWLLKWLGDSIPIAVHEDREILQLFLKRQFTPSHVFSNKLDELRHSLQICIELILQLQSAGRKFESMTLESIAVLCDAVIVPRKAMSEEQLVKCRDVLGIRQLRYPMESFAAVLEASLPNILVIAGLKLRQISGSTYPSRGRVRSA